MSYPSPPGYHGSYSQQTGDRYGYNADRNTSAHRYANQLPAPTASHSSSYGMQTYDWPHKAGSSYTNNYLNESSHDGYRQNTINPSQGYAQSGSYQEQSIVREAVAGQDNYPDRTGTRTDGLHNLAYASGLQSSSQPRAHVTHTRQSPMPQLSSSVLDRVKSPLGCTSQQNAQHNATDPYSRQDGRSSTSSPSSQQLAVNAAAALAGAVSRRFPAPSASPAKANSNLPPANTGASYPPFSRWQGPAVAQNSAYDSSLQQSDSHHGSGTRDPAADLERRNDEQSNIRRNLPQNTNQTNFVTAAHDSRVQTYTPMNEQTEAATAFVDPTRIFNPYQREHELRRQQAEAEAKRRTQEAAVTKESEQAKVAGKEQPKAQQKQTQTKTPKRAASKQNGGQGAAAKETTSTDLSNRDEESLAAEMKAMMEKMQAFKNRDPALFQKLFNDLRKGGSGPGTGATPSPSPQLCKQPIASTQEHEDTTAKTSLNQTTAKNSTSSPRPRSKKPATLPLGPDGTPFITPPNGYRVVVENNPQGLPDLGRFPAERRVRQSYGKKNKTANDGVAMRLPEATSNTSPAVQSNTLPPHTQTVPNVNSATKVQGNAWPAEKRIAVVHTAILVLKANPQNTHITLTEQDVHGMLDNNPSYIQLCEMLEGRGLKFNRSQFARELLASVPELSNSGQAKKAGGITTAATVPDSRAVPGTQLQSVSVPPKPPSMVLSEPPPLAGQVGHVQEAAIRAIPKTPKVKAEPNRTTGGKFVKPQQPPVGSKEAAARKRDFSEIVDMTGIDDEHYVVPSKHPRIEGDGPSVSEYGQPSQLNFVPGPEAIRFNHQPSPLGPPQSNNSAEKNRPTMILAKRIDKDEAAKKKFYDPKTVARDVLIASGRHPSERPLNVHLAGLVGKYIELESDVSTFTWDELDPGGPFVPPVEITDVPALEPTSKMGIRLRFPTGPKGPRTGKTTNPHSEKRDTSQTAGQTAPAPNASKHEPITTAPGDFQHRQSTPSTPGTRPVRVNVSGSPSVRRDQSITTPKTVESKTPMTDQSPLFPSGKRRGRPPGSKNKHPSLKSSQVPVEAARVQINVPIRDTPPKKDHYKCRWRLCHATLHNLDTLRKHLAKVHFVKDDVETGYVCWWRKCSLLVQEDDDQWGASQVFEDKEGWMRHIEEEHLQPIGQKWGDGPSTNHIDPLQVVADRQAYTSDTHGRQVTPLLSIRALEEQRYPRDTLSLTTVHQGTRRELTEKQNADNAAPKWYLRAQFPGSSHQQRLLSEEILRAMNVRKQKLGPGIDRGGCTLINEQRRQTLVQNPGIQRVVDADY